MTKKCAECDGGKFTSIIIVIIIIIIIITSILYYKLLLLAGLPWGDGLEYPHRSPASDQVQNQHEYKQQQQ
jgi:hypothetical protein